MDKFLENPYTIRLVWHLWHALKSINAGFNSEINGFEVEIDSFSSCFQSDEFIEGTNAFLEKRKPNF